jgi:AraC-like DNA-binding protein
LTLLNPHTLNPTPWQPTAAPTRAGAVSISRGDLHHHLAALAWLDVNAPVAREHLALPSDLYIITVYGDDGLVCGPAQETGALQVLVSLLRTQPAIFTSQGQGRLALALLTPAGLIKVLRAPLDGLADRRLPLAQFCGGAQERHLRERLVSTTDVAERLRRLGHWIESRLHLRYGVGSPQQRTARAASVLQQWGGVADLTGLAQEMAITRRQLERDFQQWLGTTPAGYARRVRFQRAAAMVCSGGRFLDAVFEHHYTDQSHLNRSFKSLSGMTPGELAALASPPHRVQERAALAGRVLMLDVPTHDT